MRVALGLTLLHVSSLLGTSFASGGVSETGVPYSVRTEFVIGRHFLDLRGDVNSSQPICIESLKRKFDIVHVVWQCDCTYRPEWRRCMYGLDVHRRRTQRLQHPVYVLLVTGCSLHADHAPQIRFRVAELQVWAGWPCACPVSFRSQHILTAFRIAQWFRPANGKLSHGDYVAEFRRLHYALPAESAPRSHAHGRPESPTRSNTSTISLCSLREQSEDQLHCPYRLK